MKINKPVRQWQLDFDNDWPISVAFIDGGKRVAAGNRVGQILVWDVSGEPPKGDGKNPPNVAPVLVLDGHENAVTHLLTTSDGKLVSCSLDRTIRIWDPSSKPTAKVDVVLDLKERQSAGRRKTAEEQEGLLTAPGLQVDAIKSLHTLEGHKDWIKALNISANGERLISGDDSCLTIVWDLASLTQVSSWHGYDRVWVSSAALSPDGKTAFTAEYAGRRSSFDVPAAQARLWNADSGEQKLDLLKIWTPKTKDRGDTYGYGRVWGDLMKRGLKCAAYSPDGKLVAAGQAGETNTGKVHLIDTESGKIVRTVSGHQYGVCDVKFSADSKYVLSSGRDTTVRICQVSDGKEVAALGKGRGGQFKDWLSAIAISPDQTRVAASDIAGLVHVWKLDG